MNDNPSPIEIALYVVGTIAAGYGAIKGFIIGYYPDEAALTWVSLIGGLLVLAGASALTKSRKARAIAARDRSKGVS